MLNKKSKNKSAWDFSWNSERVWVGCAGLRGEFSRGGVAVAGVDRCPQDSVSRRPLARLGTLYGRLFIILSFVIFVFCCVVFKIFFTAQGPVFASVVVLGDGSYIF